METQLSSEKRLSVLLVEDEPLICNLAVEALEDQGFDVRSAASVDEALRFLTSGAPIDILFTDVNLADNSDGAVLARMARELHPDLAVIYTSGRRSRIEHMEPVEGSLFVAKPYDPFNLKNLLDYLVSSKNIVCQRKRS